MSYQLPPPEAFGLPPKFTQWRLDQEQAILSIANPETRFTINIKPTGSGKSLDYVTAAIILGKRTAILTSTKGLQQQLYRDFSLLGIVVVMGKNEYRCRLFPTSCEYGPCRFGMNCSYKRGGCPYYDTLAKARKANIIITNYSFWFSHKKLFEAIGPIDFLACDEAHDTVPNMLDNMSLNISKWTHDNILKIDDYPESCLGDEYFWTWARHVSEAVSMYIDKIKEDKNRLAQAINDKRFRSLCDFDQRTGQQLLSADPDQWVVEHVGQKITYDPKWPGEYAEDMLFKGIQNILLTSATINAEILGYLGIDDKDITVNEFDSCFPKERHPVTFIPTARIYGDYRMNDRDYRIWLSRIDNIISQRLDRNGIIHGVSYARCMKIFDNSDHANYMLLHERNAKNREEVIQYFKSNKINPPQILLSPSVTTGYDFPGKECEYQIIVKLPFPDTRRKVDKIRREINPDYYNNMTMIALEQSVGRGCRSENDQCETFIIDDNWKWFRKRCGRFMHRWFKRLLKESNIIPKPMKKL